LAHPGVQTLHCLFDKMQMAFVGVGSLKDSTFIERGVIRAARLAIVWSNCVRSMT